MYDARRVAEAIGIPYYVVNQEERFERDVVRPFVQEYLSGRTPIPCSLCNNHLKFDQLLITARQIGADKLATGHYARCEFGSYTPAIATDAVASDKRTAQPRWLLRRGADIRRDQTYFLFGLTQEQLSRTLFPLGELRKTQVRELAREFGLELAETETGRSTTSPAAICPTVTSSRRRIAPSPSTRRLYGDRAALPAYDARQANREAAAFTWTALEPISPPARSTTRLTIAKPSPNPSDSPRLLPR